MKRLSIIIGLAVALTCPALAAEQSLLARVTVYWRGESCQRAAWRGTPLRPGHCAVDPKKIPYGSKVIFPDGTCTAVDTGTDVVNRKAARLSGRTPSQRSALVIDRYFDSKQEALAWTRRHPIFMTVQVLTPASQRAGAGRLQASLDGGLPATGEQNYVASTSHDLWPLPGAQSSIYGSDSWNGDMTMASAFPLPVL